MSTLRRNTPLAHLGAEIHDTHINFVVLKPVQGKETNQSRLGAWGRQTIAFDAVKEGRVVQVSQVSHAISKMKHQAGVDAITFLTTSDAQIDEQWKELFSIAGFTTVETAPRAPALDKLLLDLGESSLPILYFIKPEQATLYHYGVEIAEYEYPFNLQAVFELQDYVASQEGEPLRLCGRMEVAPREMINIMDEYAILAEPARLWRNCFDTSTDIPTLPYEEAFEYTTAIALSYYGAWFYYRYEHEQELPQKGKQVRPVTRASSVSPAPLKDKEVSLSLEADEQVSPEQQAAKEAGDQAQAGSPDKHTFSNKQASSSLKQAWGDKLSAPSSQTPAEAADTPPASQQDSPQEAPLSAPKPRRLRLPRLPTLWLEDADQVLGKMGKKVKQKLSNK